MNESTGATTTGAPVVTPSYSISFDGTLPLGSDPGLVFGQEVTGTFRARIDGVNLRRDWDGNPGYTARVSVIWSDLGEACAARSGGSGSARAVPIRHRRVRARLRRIGSAPIGRGIVYGGAFILIYAGFLLAARVAS